MEDLRAESQPQVDGDETSSTDFEGTDDALTPDQARVEGEKIARRAVKFPALTRKEVALDLEIARQLGGEKSLLGGRRRSRRYGR